MWKGRQQAGGTSGSVWRRGDGGWIGSFSTLYHVLQLAEPSAWDVPWLQKSHVLLTRVQTGKEKARAFSSNP